MKPVYIPKHVTNEKGIPKYYLCIPNLTHMYNSRPNLTHMYNSRPNLTHTYNSVILTLISPHSLLQLILIATMAYYTCMLCVARLYLYALCGQTISVCFVWPDYICMLCVARLYLYAVCGQTISVCCVWPDYICVLCVARLYLKGIKVYIPHSLGNSTVHCVCISCFLSP